MNSSIITKTNPSPASAADEEDLDIGRYIDVLVSNKWLIAAITLVALLQRSFITYDAGHPVA